MTPSDGDVFSLCEGKPQLRVWCEAEVPLIDPAANYGVSLKGAAGCSRRDFCERRPAPRKPIQEAFMTQMR